MTLGEVRRREEERVIVVRKLDVIDSPSILAI